MHLPPFSNGLLFVFAAYVFVCVRNATTVPRALRIATLAAAAIASAMTIKNAVQSVANVDEWDFLCFWLYGHAAVAHANIYAPATYHALALPIAVRPDFGPQMLDVGFPYPPPSIALFAPLGAFASIHLASAVWMAFLLAALVAAIAVISRPYETTARYAIATLAFSLPATTQTIGWQQTNFVALLAVAVAAGAANRSGLRAGIAAGAAAIVKPYLAVVTLWLVLRRRWCGVVASVASVAVVTLGTILLLGTGGGSRYFHERPAAARMPAIVFRENNDASLYAGLLRHTRGGGSLNGLLHDPLLATIVGTLGLATVALVVLAADADADLALGLLVAFALIAYPGTSVGYAIVLLPTAVALARRLDARRAPLCALVAAAFYAANAAQGDATVLAYGAAWLTLAGTLARSMRRRRNAPDQEARGAARWSATIARSRAVGGRSQRT